MNYKISKELFEAAMNYNHKLDSIIVSGEFVTGITNTSLHKLFVNDFFFKCKEWAYNQGYIIFSSQQKTGWAVFIQTDSDGIVASFEGLEQQAVFDACMWILDSKDK